MNKKFYIAVLNLQMLQFEFHVHTGAGAVALSEYRFFSFLTVQL